MKQATSTLNLEVTGESRSHDLAGSDNLMIESLGINLLLALDPGFNANHCCSFFRKSDPLVHTRNLLEMMREVFRRYL